MKNTLIYAHLSEVCLEKSVPFFPILQSTIEKVNDVLILTASEAEARDIKRVLIKSTKSTVLPQIMSLSALLTMTNTTHTKTKTERFIDIKNHLKTIPTRKKWFQDIKHKQGFIRHLESASTLYNQFPFDTKVYANHHPLGFGKSQQSLNLIQKIGQINPAPNELTPFEAERLAAYTKDKTLFLIGLTYLTQTEKNRLTHLISHAQTCISWIYDNATEDVLQNPHHFYSFIKTHWTVSEMQQVAPSQPVDYPSQLITKHASKKDEVRHVLNTISTSLNSNTVTLDQIQILTQTPNSYTSLFRDYCALLNIPFNEGKKPFFHYKVIEFILAALNTKAEKYSRISLLNWLKNPVWKQVSARLDYTFFDWLMKEYSLHDDIVSIQNAIENCIKKSPEISIDSEIAESQLLVLNKIDTVLHSIETASNIPEKLIALSQFINDLQLNIDEETTFITQSFLNIIRSLESKISSTPFQTFYAELCDIATVSNIQIPTPPTHAVLRIDTLDHYIHNPRALCFILGAENIGAPSSGNRSIFFPENLKKRLFLPNTHALSKQYLCHNLRATNTLAISFTQDSPEINGDISQAVTEAFQFLNWKIDSVANYENTVILPKDTGLKRWPALDSDNTFGQFEAKNKDHWQTKLCQKALSPTALESYQRCPYRFYLETVLGEKILFKKNDDIQAHIWGSFLHHILQLFYEEFQEKDKRVRPFNLETANKILEKIACTQLKYKENAHFYWRVKALLLLNNEAKKGLLSTILDIEANDETDLYPSAFESRFKNIKLTLNNGQELAINGAIDMILKDATQPGIAILDYKTGKNIPTKADIDKFRHLQLPIYLMVAKQLYPDTPILGGILFQINSPDKCEKKVLISTKEAKKDIFKLDRKHPARLDREFEENLITHISLLYGLISTAYFSHNHHPKLAESKFLRKQTCLSCAYWNACQYPERFK